MFHKTNTLWEPKKIHHTVSTFLESFSNSINDSIKEKQNHTPVNLTKEETKALQNLMHMNDIIICNADKGGAVVILDVADYIQEAMRQLSKTEHYKALPTDPTALHCELVNSTIEKFKNEGTLKEKLAEGLKVSEPRTPIFYLLPKIHKENNPGRPVISSINCHTTKISEFVDYHLQPFVKSLYSYVQDTTDFLNKIKDASKNLPEQTILVTMDVKSLYTNIPNQEGIDAVKSFLEYSEKQHLIPVIKAFLWLILTLNNFTFNDKNFLQTSGVSMGTKCAPTYANLFMGYFENTYILPFIENKSSNYLRYIDDIFFLWHGTEDELKTFLTQINNVHPTIKFDSNYSYTQINFLDTTIKKNLKNELITTLYKKDTDRNTYLHKKSYHPPATKRSIPYSQALRVSRICSEDEDYIQQLEELKAKFILRGYKEDEIITEFNKATLQDRQNLLTYQTKERSTKLVFTTKYNKNAPSISKSIEDNWHLLQINNNISQAFKEKPVVGYKRNPNLRQLIGQHRLSKGKVIKPAIQSTGNCKPCRSQQGNKCCKLVQDTSSFMNRHTGKIFRIFHQLTCKSTNVIYLMECKKCNSKAYVGKSEIPVHKRINGHRSDAKKATSIPVDAHYLQPGHNFDRDTKFTLIEQIRRSDLTKEQMTELLLRREDFWMLKLQTLVPNGFNVELNYPNK